MQFVINKGKFAKVLNNVAKIANSRNQLPILNNVLLRADAGKLVVIANNLELASEEILEATIKKNGVITVPARPLAEFINNLPEAELTIATEDTKMRVTSKGFAATFNGASAEEFPEVPELEAAALTFNLPLSDFQHGLQRVIGAASNDFSRPALTGVCFSSFEKRLMVAATDGYRLAEVELMPKFSDEMRVIVPSAAIMEVLAASDEGDLTVWVGATQMQFLFTSGSKVTTNLIAGSYPDYRQLIPEPGEDTVVAQREELTRLLRAAQVFARIVDNTAMLKTDSKKGELSVVAVESELGSNASEMPAVVSGKDLTMAFNIRFLMDALGVFDAPEVILDFSSGKLILRGNDSGSLVYIVMPRKA